MRPESILAPLVFLAGCTAPQSSSAESPAGSGDSPAIVATADWAMDGTWTDACCCKVSCPCLFGSGPTEGFCEGASLFEVDSGHHAGVTLDGLSAIVVYRVKGWTRIVVEEGASPEQVAAFGRLVPELLAFVTKGPTPSVVAGELSVSRDATGIRYATPGTEVELALLESATGEPIRLEGLPAKGTPFPVSHGHTQYMSRRLAHESDAGGFEWSERNGFSSELKLASAGGAR